MFFFFFFCNLSCSTREGIKRNEKKRNGTLSEFYQRLKNLDFRFFRRFLKGRGRRDENIPPLKYKKKAERSLMFRCKIFSLKLNFGSSWTKIKCSMVSRSAEEVISLGPHDSLRATYQLFLHFKFSHFMSFILSLDVADDKILRGHSFKKKKRFPFRFSFARLLLKKLFKLEQCLPKKIIISRLSPLLKFNLLPIEVFT